MRVIWIERGAAGRDRAGEVATVGGGNVAVALSLPQHHGHLDGGEVEPPRARHEPHVPDGASGALAARLRVARHEAVANLGTFQQAPIGLGKRRGHPFTCAFPTAAHRPEVEPEEAAQHSRGIPREPDHHAERRAHRRDDAWSVGGGHAAEQADDPNPVRNQRSACSRVRRPARGTEHGKRVEPEGRGQLLHVIGPVHDPAAGLEIRPAHPRPVGRDDPDAEFGGDGGVEDQVAFDTRARRAVTVDDRQPARAAIFCVGQDSPVTQPDLTIVGIGHAG